MNTRVTLLALVAVAGALLLLAPGATAHTTYQTDDDEYCITIGQNGEPIYTFQRTNLDLIIRVHLSDGDCDDSEDGEVGGVHETLQASLIAPGGEELASELRTQHGETNRYQFTDGYTLTQPGFYHLRLMGEINGSPVDADYLIDHNIREQSEIMFPDQDLPTAHDVSALQERVDQLEAQLAEGQTGGGSNNEAPGPGALLLVGLLAFSTFFLRSRARQ